MNKQVLIFGASGGLGYELLKIFISKNYEVIATGSNKVSINKSKKKFKYSTVDWNICDFKKEFQVIKVIDKYFNKKNNPDIVIICSAVSRYDGLRKLSYKDLVNDFKINLFSNIIINKQVQKKKIKNKKVLIISIGSSSSYNGFQNTISYCSSKHGLLGAVRSINAECNKDKIFNTCVSMGSMQTNMGKKVKNQNYKYFIKPEKIAKYIYEISSSDAEAYVEDIFFKRSKF